MSEAEQFFLHLNITCISISVNSLFISFVHFSTWLPDLSLLVYRSSLSIREISPLLFNCSPPYCCLFTLLMMFLESPAFFNFKYFRISKKFFLFPI